MDTTKLSRIEIESLLFRETTKAALIQSNIQNLYKVLQDKMKDEQKLVNRKPKAAQKKSKQLSKPAKK